MACDRLGFAEYVVQKLDSLHRQIRQIQCGDFPYQAPHDALAALQIALTGYGSLLEEAVSEGDEDQIIAACKTLNFKIVEYHPILGFLLRATNVRNSFEAYDPLKELAPYALGF